MANLKEQTLQQRNAELEKELADKTIELNRKDRGLEIEASLERVRANAMAMQKSDDLALVVATIFEELDHLHLETLRCGIGILNKEKCSADVWTTTQSEKGNIVQVTGDEPMDIHPLLKQAFDTWVEQREDHSYILEGDDLIRFYKALKNTNFKLPDSQSITSQSVMLRQYYYVAILKAGGLYAFRETPFPDEAKMLMKRFADVFNLTYTRFLDLQKAEAQTREAKIEAALERVRSRTMAMQRSEELQDAANLLFKQVQGLGIPVWSCGYNIFEKDEKTCIGWMSSEGFIQPPFKIPLTENPTFVRFLESRKKNEQFYVEEVGGVALEAHYRYMLTLPDFAQIAENFFKAGYPFPSFQINHVVNFSLGNLIFISNKQIPEAWDVFKRFAKVFEQTYIRFLDLQKAEAQAKEAKIEAALERVRSKAMAMQKSEDLGNAIAILFEQLDKLELRTVRCGISIINKEKRTTEVWSTSKSGTDTLVQVSGDESMDIHPLLKGSYDAWLKQEDFSYTLEGDDFDRFYAALGLTNFKLPEADLSGTKPTRPTQFLYVSHFPAGGLYAFSRTTFAGEAKMIIRRFADVFNLTYTRFRDLQQAEAQAKDAKIEVALERVRARALAMQTSNELLEVANTLREQMGMLGVKELEASVVHLYYENSAIFDVCYAFRPAGILFGEIVTGIVQFRIDECALAREFFEMYKSPVNEYTLEVSGDKLKEWLNLLLMKSPDLKKYWVDGIPQVGIYHFSNFSGGSLLMVSQQKPSEEACNLQRRAASVFDLAYRRFLDLQHKEQQALNLLQEKQRLEHTLAELRSAQSQLIQAEKMASLGELTAGIAHEIQNPLNFVNNFSEVSNELLDEMKSELDKGNRNEAMAIAKDLQQNLEKILNHGKRADAIVKGMLQHSRTSGGQKESIDINVLADEYLRLTYHGLRAKDKTFNATMKTNFDNTIGKINIVPQDIGRMLLNIYNNAFYAVGKKKSQTPLGYEPVVSVSTKKLADKVEIRIKDNGNGIPQKILDKIFQPFFTTKPTGQGTGLGLSLAYDIVKAHGGEIRVETKEGDGAEFVVELSAKQVDR